MTFTAFLFQALNGLATASGLFFVAAGLSLIFGVTRIVNIAHGSLYMLGTYIAYSLRHQRSAARSASGAALSRPRIVVGVIGALIEIVLLRRIYRAPELFQLLATFALVLIINDATLWLWGPEDLLGPRAPGLRGAVEILGRHLPSYDLFLIVVAPAGAAARCMSRSTRTRFGRLVRAATQDREMVGALGVNQALLFTAVFALGAALAGFGGALQVAREPANLATDLTAISDAFVVVVVGGMGSITGAYLAAVIIAEVKAHLHRHRRGRFRLRRVNFSKLTLVAEFLVMAVVLIARPYGLLGRAQAAVRSVAEPECSDPAGDAGAQGAWRRRAALLLCLPLLAQSSPYLLVLGIDVLIAVIFAASLHFIAGPGGMHSFGHAAYFGLGAYGAALLVKWLAVPMGLALVAAPLVALAGALLFGWFAVRLSGVYLAMLTLAFAQIVWVDRVPMGGTDRRLQRRDRRLAAAAVRPSFGLFPADAGAGGRRGAAAAALAVRAVRLRHARRARFAAARRSHRHRRQARALARLRHRRRASAASPAACSPSPRARSRRRPSASAAPSTAW